MKDRWPLDATDEERSLRLFKDALMGHAATAVVLSAEDEEYRRRAAAEVEDAYARVREYSPEELEGYTAPTYAEVLTALRLKNRGLEVTLPSHRVLAHMLADLDYYFFALPGRGYVYDMPDLTDEERAAEHGLRHDLLLKLYDELEPAFDVSLSWPPRGHEVNENGELVKTEPPGMAAIGFDCGYDFLVFHQGHADDEEYVAGFIEGCLERLLDQDEPEESDHLRDLWENGDEKKPTAVGWSSGGRRSPATSPCTTQPLESGTRSQPPDARPGSSKTRRRTVAGAGRGRELLLRHGPRA